MGTEVTAGAPTTVPFVFAAGGTTSSSQRVNGKLCALQSAGLNVAADLTFEASIDGGAWAAIKDGALGTAAARKIATANTTTAAFYLPLSLNDWLGVILLRLVASAAQTAGATVTGILAG